MVSVLGAAVVAALSLLAIFPSPAFCSYAIDANIEFLECSGNDRKVKIRNPYTDSVVTTSASTQCDCTIIDFEPVYSSCEGGRRNFDWAVRNDSLCMRGKYKPKKVDNVRCACTTDDVVYAISECNLAAKTKTWVTSYQTDTHGVPLCDPGAPDSIELPRGSSFPCDLSCPVGSVLPPGSSTCVQCQAGTYSMGGGKRISTWMDDMWNSADFKGFRTYCTGNGGCSPWVMNVTAIHSGDNTGVENMESVLEASVDIVRGDGYVEFAYRVDAEDGFDGLLFFVDETPMEIQKNHRAGIPVSTVPLYETVRIPLSTGMHLLRWVYHKDIAFSVGDDRAFIKNITLQGTSLLDTTCYNCPPGYTSEKGAVECKPCEKNTYAGKAGSSSCAPCQQANKYSPPGSPRCYQRPKCAKQDTLYTRSECTQSDSGGMVMTKMWEYTQPKVCYIQDDSHLIINETEACPACDGGGYRDSTSLRCRACPLGSAPKDAKTTAAGLFESMCEECPAGSAAVPSLEVKSNFRSWDALKEMGFAVRCSDGQKGCENTAEGGWSLRGNHIESGRANVPGSQVILSLDVYTIVNEDVDDEDDDNTAYIEFDYSVVHDILGRQTDTTQGQQFYIMYDTAKLELLVDGKEVGKEFKRGDHGTTRLPLKSKPPSMTKLVEVKNDSGKVIKTYKIQHHTVLWIYTTAKHRTKLSGSHSSEGFAIDAAAISRIQVFGVSPYMGNFADGKMVVSENEVKYAAVSCVQCQNGTHAEAGSFECKPCPAGTYSNTESGVSKCEPCAEDYFNPAIGSSTCYPCPSATSTDGKTGAVQCSHHDCSFSFMAKSANDLVRYDLSPLMNKREMMGPVLDNNSEIYYISVCRRPELNSSEQVGYPCRSTDGLACQEDTGGRVHSLGQFVGARPLLDSDLHRVLGGGGVEHDDDADAFLRHGLVLSYTGGTKCSNGWERSMHVVMLCDSEAGTGAPELPDGSPVEARGSDGDLMCDYTFKWKSAVACPACSDMDFELSVGGCERFSEPIDLGGGQSLAAGLYRKSVYMWKTPKLCGGGLKLPPAFYDECSSVSIDHGRVEVDMNAAVVAGSVLGSILTLLLISILVLYIKNRRMYAKYQRVSLTSAEDSHRGDNSFEMGGVTFGMDSDED